MYSNLMITEGWIFHNVEKCPSLSLGQSSFALTGNWPTTKSRSSWVKSNTRRSNDKHIHHCPRWDSNPWPRKSSLEVPCLNGGLHTADDACARMPPPRKMSKL